MWAQLMKVQLKPGTDLSALADVLEAAEQPGSGLLRELFMREQNDPDSACILAVFESEEKAREREQDPRRVEGQQAITELMVKVLAAPPDFTDLTVTADWVPYRRAPAEAALTGTRPPRTPMTTFRTCPVTPDRSR